MANLTNLDNVTKTLIVVLTIIVSYFIILTIIKPLFIKPVSMTEMMRRVMSDELRIENYLSAMLAIAIGIIVSLFLFKRGKKENQREDKKENEYRIIRKVLSEDEKKILDEIKKAKEITQDSLRFRLGWSKAKISTILTNLDKANLIQRERTGKTYKVFLEKGLKPFN